MLKRTFNDHVECFMNYPSGASPNSMLGSFVAPCIDLVISCIFERIKWQLPNWAKQSSPSIAFNMIGIKKSVFIPMAFQIQCQIFQKIENKKMQIVTHGL